MRANIVAVAAAATFLGNVIVAAQEFSISNVANKTVTIGDKHGSHYYIGSTGRIYETMWGGKDLPSLSDWGYEYVIGKTLQFKTKVSAGRLNAKGVLASIGAVDQEARTKASLSGSVLVLELQTMTDGRWGPWFKMTIELNGDNCTATATYGTVACRIVEGRRLP